MKKNEIIAHTPRIWVFEDAELNEKFDEMSEYISGDSFDTQSYSAMLVLEEAFVNIMKHAYEGQATPRTPVMISILKNIDTNETEMTFVDFGSYFDPTTYDYTTNRPGEKIGGEGIKMLNLYTKLMKYSRAGQANILHMII